MDVYVSRKFLPLKFPNDMALEAFDQLKVIVAVSDIVAWFLSRKLTVALADPPVKLFVDE